MQSNENALRGLTYLRATLTPRRIALVKLRLSRIGKRKQPYYRIVAMNVSAPRNGRALAEVGYDGTLIPDHIPQMGDDNRLGTAYTLAYMKALQKRAEDEVG